MASSWFFLFTQLYIYKIRIGTFACKIWLKETTLRCRSYWSNSVHILHTTLSTCAQTGCSTLQFTLYHSPKTTLYFNCTYSNIYATFPAWRKPQVIAATCMSNFYIYVQLNEQVPWGGNKLTWTTRYCTWQVCSADSWVDWNSRNFRGLFCWTSWVWLKTTLYGPYEGSSTLWPLSLTQRHFFLSSLLRRLTLQFQPSKRRPVTVRFLGAFAILRKPTISFVMSVCLPVRPYGTTRLPVDGISWNFVFEYFSKTCLENSSSIKISQKQRVLYTKIGTHLWPYLSQFFLEWEMFRNICK